MVFSRQEYWRGLPFPFPGDLPQVSYIAGGFLDFRQILFFFFFLMVRQILYQLSLPS